MKKFKEFIERMTVSSEENNDMHESIDNYDSDDLIEIFLDQHDVTPTMRLYLPCVGARLRGITA